MPFTIHTAHDMSFFYAHPEEVLQCAEHLMNHRVRVSSTVKNAIIFGQGRAASEFTYDALAGALEFYQTEVAESYHCADLAARLGYETKDVSGGAIPSHALFLPKMMHPTFLGRNTVSCHHTVANGLTLLNMSMFDSIYPIVMTRNVLDALVSNCESIMKRFKESPDEFHCTFASHDYLTPLSNEKLAKNLLDSSFSEQMDFFIDMTAYWSFAFLVSWEKVAKKGWHDVLFLHYEDVVDNEAETLKRIAKFLEQDVSTEKIEKTVADLLIQRGVPADLKKKIGRGRKVLTEQQIEKVIKIGKYFGDDEIIEKYVLS